MSDDATLDTPLGTGDLAADIGKHVRTGGQTDLTGLYQGYFDLFGDDASNRLDEARLKTRAALAAALAPEGSMVVECGTFLGHDTALLAGAVGASGRIHTFDGCPLTTYPRTEALRAMRAVHSARIVVYPAALYDGQRDRVTAAFSPDKPGHTVIHHDPAVAARAFGGNPQLAEVPASSLDRLFEVRGTALLWIDAQGSAPFVVAGAQRLLAEDRPAVVFEYAHT